MPYAKVEILAGRLLSRTVARGILGMIKLGKASAPRNIQHLYLHGFQR